MSVRFAGVSAAALCAAMAAPAWAQDTTTEIVVTAQARNATVVRNAADAGVLGDKPAEDLPFNVRSYDESLILNQQPQTLAEVLENDPTMRTSYGFGNAAELFVIRGFALFGDDVGLNGLYGIAPRQLVAPELFDSVQVLNGASAFLNGAAPGGSGLGGSVNLVLKRAGTARLARGTLGYTGREQLGGSFDVARRFGANDAWGVRVNGAWRDGEVAIDREDRRTRVIGAGLDYDAGGRLRAALDLAWQEVRVDSLRPKVTITGAIPSVPRSDANYAQDFSFTEMADLFGTASLEYDLADNALFYAKAGARDGREEGIYSGLTVLNAATGAANGNALVVPRTDNNEAVEAGLRVKLDAPISHEINFGGNALWQVNRNAFDFRYGPGFAGFATNLYDPVQVALPSSTLVGGNLADPFPISRSTLASAFASDTIGLLDERVLLTGGVRLQTIKVRAYNYYNGGLLDTAYSEDAITPVAGIVVKPGGGISLYANRIEALQQGSTAPVDPALVNPGEVLAPRRSTQYEIGGKVRIGALFASLAAYRIKRPGEGLLPNGRYGYTGIQRHRGIEAAVNGDVVPGLRVIAGAALNDARLIGGKDVAGVPGFTANADAEWDLPFAPGLTLTGRMLHTGKQWVDAANTLRLPSWTRFDAGARFVLAAGDTPITLRLTVDNIADKRYWASAFDSFSTALLQGQPRTVKASISADF